MYMLEALELCKEKRNRLFRPYKVGTLNATTIDPPGVSAYEEGLRMRRRRLRDLLLDEQSDLSWQLTEGARRTEVARAEEARAAAEELRDRRERERSAYVAAKRQQQCSASCQVAREEYSKGCAINAKLSNIAQIADNEARKSAARELEALWRRATQRRLETEMLQEMRDSARRTSMRLELARALAEQVAEKSAVQEEEKRKLRQSELERSERLCEESRLADSRDLQLRRQRQRELKRELEEGMLAARQQREERAREEAAAERAERAMFEERSTRNVGSLRTESTAYVGYLEDLRRDEVKRERELEAVVECLRADAEARRELARRELEEARERGLRKVLHAREEQVRARRDAQATERRLKAEEREALERQIESDAKLIATEKRESEQKAYRYGLELKEQQRRLVKAEEAEREAG
ncbi:PREDICTED: trichohyalin-like [Dinoponera quadriceps]|uniref:Trichohyalin-like n=1 Tax=Dinoponera quadriceps TaxID=609295 RepID=A0A6P3YCD1_DINQU|nr:PREDICTED: trichohyalin-like [Dinoponera quadriceps]